MKESVIEARLVARALEHGGEVRKVAWVGRRDAPDRLVMLPERGVLTAGEDNHWVGWKHQPATIWVELKKPGVKPRIGQLNEHKKLRAMGQRVEVIDSLEGVDALFA